MAHVVTHSYVNPEPDLGDPGVTGPDEWNANHVVTIDPTIINHNALNNLTVGDPHTQYHTDARALTWLGTRSTSDLPEGSNKYYTDERVDDRVATLIQNGTGISWSYDDAGGTLTPTVTLAPFSTTNLAEGTNLYYTAARFNTAFATKTTSDLTEGSNLYYTAERVDDRVAALIQNGTGLSWTYDDAGNTLTGNVTYPGSFSGFANPTASVGLAAVNGSATTAMRSDAAPPLSQSITPTWLGVHLASAAYRNSTYVRIGSTTVPNNVTDGDLTVIRFSIGNVSLAGTGLVFQLKSTASLTSAGSYASIEPVLTLGTGSTSSANFVVGPTSITVTDNIALYTNVAADLVINAITVGKTFGDAIVYGSSMIVSATTGSLTNLVHQRMLSPSFNGGAIKPTSIMGLDIQNQGASGITTAVGIDLAAMSGATNNFSIRNAGNMVQTGYVRFGGVTPTANVTDGDVTGIRFFGTTFDASTGYRVAGGATSGNVLRGNGANFVDAQLAASDIGSGAALTRVNDTNVTLTLGGTPASALLAATSLTLSWTGTLAVARGGIGVGTLAANGVLYGNGTGAVQALAVNAGSRQFLTQTSSAVPTWLSIVAGDLPANGANPTASVGLAAVNGSATTWMRSDGAPALSQTIAPTWTNLHTFQSSRSTNLGQVVIHDTAAGNSAGIGGRISFGFIYDGANYANPGEIGVEKENSTSGNYAGALVFYNAANGGNNAEKMRITSAGNTYLLGALRVGGITAPTNITAGDATATRLMLGTDVAFDTNTYFTPGSAAQLQINAGQGHEYAGGGIVLTTPTAATNTQDQASPGISFTAKGWNTSGTPASANFGAGIWAVAVQSAGLGSSYIGFATASPTTGVYPFYSAKLIHGGIFDVAIGLRVGGVAAAGDLLIGSGSNYVASPTAFTTLTFTAGDYTADVGNWTVASGDLFAGSYNIVGKYMTVSLSVFTSTTSSTPQFLFFKIPASKTASRYMYSRAIVVNNTTIYSDAVVQTVAGDTHIYVRRDWNLTAFPVITDLLSVMFTFTFEIQ